MAQPLATCYIKDVLQNHYTTITPTYNVLFKTNLTFATISNTLLHLNLKGK